MKNIKINTEYIKLDSFLKWCGEASTGSEGKFIVLEGKVLVNGELEIRRGRKIYPGYEVEVNGNIYKVS